MTLQAAMDFLDAIRERAELEAALTEVRDYAGLVQTGEQHGFAFTAEELVQAFRHRCAMHELRRHAKLG